MKGIFENECEVEYYPGNEITPQRVKDADALIVRTRTKCNAQLLEGSKVKVIASATIGTDHIDRQWCQSHNIALFNAPGCNSGGVLQYFLTALFKCLSTRELSYGKNSLILLPMLQVLLRVLLKVPLLAVLLALMSLLRVPLLPPRALPLPVRPLRWA